MTAAAVDVKAGISKTFTTRNTLTSNQSILMRLVDGPFKADWRLEVYSAEPDACKIEFPISISSFTNKLIEMAFGRIFKELAANMVQAFLRAPKGLQCRLIFVLKSPTHCLKNKVSAAGHPLDGATVEQAIIASGLLALRDDIDLAKNKLGIYSRPVKLHDESADGDRVEIYRPLITEIKELRRQRAEKRREVTRSSRPAISHKKRSLSAFAFPGFTDWSTRACYQCWLTRRHC